MTKGRLQHVIERYKQQLQAHETSAEQILDAAHKRTLQALQAHLELLYKQIADKQASGETIPVSWLYERARLQTLEQQIQSQISAYATFAQGVTNQLQHVGVMIGSLSADAQLQALIPLGVNFSFKTGSYGAMKNMVGATQAGSPLATLFNGYGAEAAHEASQALVNGLRLGYGVRQVAKDVQQALGISRNRALTTARTEMLRAYRSSALDIYRSNSDTVSQWRWMCSLSIRTCAACLAMDGTLHNLDEDMNEHCNGRCTPVPVTKSWNEILGPLGIDTSGIPDTRLVDDMQNGASWLAEQDSATQKSILGAKYDGFVAGDFSLKDIVGHNDDPTWGGSIYVKSLKELAN